MKKVHKFMLGFAFAMMVAISSPVFADIVLQCSGGTCCTFDSETGQIHDCHPASQ